MRWTGHVAGITQMRSEYDIWVGKPKGKRLLGRPGRRREDNIKMHLRVMGWEIVDWIYLVQDRNQW
jgi:hypothetical protein